MEIPVPVIILEKMTRYSISHSNTVVLPYLVRVLSRTFRASLTILSRGSRENHSVSSAIGVIFAVYISRYWSCNVRFRLTAVIVILGSRIYVPNFLLVPGSKFTFIISTLLLVD